MKPRPIPLVGLRVRRPLFQAPMPALFGQDTTRHLVIREDGTLDEEPTLKL